MLITISIRMNDAETAGYSRGFVGREAARVLRRLVDEMVDGKDLAPSADLAVYDYADRHVGRLTVKPDAYEAPVARRIR